jgi:hypothetical protein
MPMSAKQHGTRGDPTWQVSSWPGTYLLQKQVKLKSC